jgi:CubicO group peptidase (beta-lactamase class C family)
MVTALPHCAPSRHGADANGIAAFLDATRDTELHSLMIVRHGHVIAAGWWRPYGPGRPHLLYSLSKSFTATAAGLAAAEGLLSLDAPVLSYFPELDAEVTDPRSRAMLVRHIASMSSGHLADTWPAAPGADPGNPVRAFLRMPPDAAPGTVFAYNQSCTYTLAAIVQRVTGQPLLGYLRPRLLDVIGIGAAAWEELPPGQALGFSGLYATTDAIARLGLLYLRGGRWEGRQVLPAAWVAEATRAHVATAPAGGSPAGASPDWSLGYGFQFWMSRHGFRGDGAFGQFCLVLPDHDAVIAITAGTEDMQGVLNAAWEHVLPAFGDCGPGGCGGCGGACGDSPGTGADEALASRPRGLRLRPRHGSAPAAWPAAGAAPVALAPAALGPAGGAAQALPSVRRVLVADRAITVEEEGLAVTLPLAEGDWRVSEAPVPAAASCGWTGPGELAVDIAFLQTPHRLSLECSLREGTFGARWHTRPLNALDSLGWLRAPEPPAGAGGR